MDWANERYVRIYTRKTADDLILSWEARALWKELICVADRSGVIATSHGPRGLAVLVNIPADVVSASLPELIGDGRISECLEPRGYVLRNYIPAQETPSSDAQRKRDERERRGKDANNSVTKRDNESQNVTESHERSRGVTRSHSVPSRAVPDSADPIRAVPNLGETARAGARKAGHQFLSPDFVVGSVAPVTEDQSVTEPAWFGVKPTTGRRATQLPANWGPTAAHVEMARSIGVVASDQAEQFRDYHTAKGSTMKDWDAAFRTWLRNAKRFQGGPRSAMEIALAGARGEV